jgi:hypothetical protein
MLAQNNFYRSDGAAWFENIKFNNAIFQYRRAKELFPEK